MHGWESAVHFRSKSVFVLAVASLAVAPGVASAATKSVVAGPPIKKTPAGVPKDGDINQFFPAAVKVHAGDSVKFTIAGFHLINFPKKGQPAPPLAMPDTTHPATNVLDAAGAAYWFNGQGTPVIPAIVGLGSGSGKSYTGAKELGSGFPSGNGPPKPFVVKFPKAGSYTYYCVLHYGMKGKVTVVAKSKPVPSPKADFARVAPQLAKGLATLKKLDKQKAPANTVVAGPDKSSAVLYRFTPAALSTKVGTPITLTMSDGTSEDHTFTFAKDIKAAIKAADATFIGPLPGTGNSGPPTLAFDPKWAYPSDAPGCARHLRRQQPRRRARGLRRLDGNPATPFPQKVSMSFSKPGTYSYFCAIHTDMVGKITVTS